MAKIERSKVSYIFDGLAEGVLPEETVAIIRSMLAMESLYLSATREIATKLEILNDEFQSTKARNPIQFVQTRVKTPKSILDKLARRGFPVTVESAREHLTDIAGIRVICSYIDDIYLIAGLLVSQDDIDLVRVSDYIQRPKPNGYRSLHLIVTVPVFLSDRTEHVKAEIQIRTIAMDFWASLDHELSYKLGEGKLDEVARELKACADVIADTDRRMQALHDVVAGSASGEAQAAWAAAARKLAAARPPATP